MKALVITILFLTSFFVNLIQAQEEPNYSKFPESTYWVNVEYKLAPNTFKDKLLVVLFWDMNDPVGKMYCDQLEDLNRRSQQMQLVSIVGGDAEHPVVLSDMKAFVQDNAINHPLGIAGDLWPFVDVTTEITPSVFVYWNSVDAPQEFGFNNVDDLTNLMQALNKILLNRELSSKYSYWQMKPSPAPQEYAVPVISYPSLLAANAINNSFYIYENSQHKISNYSPTGNAGSSAGGKFGDMSGSLSSARIGRVTGMEFDHTNDVLCFVDFSAHKVKVADFVSDLVYDLNVIDPNMKLNFPVDLTFMDTSMYVLNLVPAKVSQIGMKGKRIISELSLSPFLLPSERVLKISAGKKIQYVITSKGRVLTVKDNAVSVFYSSVKWDEYVSDVAESKKGVFLLMPRKHQIVLKHRNSNKVVYSTPMSDSNIFDDVQEDILKLPNSLCVLGKNIILSDQGNNLIRMINISKKNTKRLDPEFSQQMAMSEDAVAAGEFVYFEQEIFGSGTNEIEILFELQGMKLLPTGRNEFSMDENSGIEYVEGTLTEKGARVRVTPKEEAGFGQMELYLTIFDPAYPQVIYFKRAVLNLEYQVISGEEKTHTLMYRPNIKVN